MIDIDLCYTSAVDLSRMIRSKQLSPVDLMRNVLARIENVNPTLNAFCFVYPEEAMAHARTAEEAIIRGGATPPLLGIPVAIKDLTPTRGKRTTLGSYTHEHWIPDFNPVVVERLLKAGAIIVGKTITSEFACALRSGNPLFGITRNPWDLDRAAGWSSAGAAAAVASGCVPLAEGSDAGGSVRNPAAYCGLVGYKPSFGRIPFDILPSQLDQTCHFGPIARRVDDAALFLDVTQGPDDRDIQAFMGPIEIPIPLPDDVHGLRIAYSPTLGYAAIDPEIAENMERAVEALGVRGALVERIPLKLTKVVSQVDAVHWDVYAAVLYDELVGDPDDRWRSKLDPMFLASVERGRTVMAVDLKRGEFVATRLWNTLAPILREYDALLCAGALTPAISLDSTLDEFGQDDEQGRFRARSLAGVFNLVSQCPSLQVPTGFTADGLPTGIQIVSGRYKDVMALRVGKAIESALPHYRRRPDSVFLSKAAGVPADHLSP